MIEKLNDDLERTKKSAFNMGVKKGIYPFMTLSFMALTVIPELRITTKGAYAFSKQDFVI